MNEVLTANKNISSELENRKKRVIFRAGHRGTQEFDLIIGGFVKSCINSFDESGVNVIEELLQESDAQISDWLNGVEKTPDRFIKAIKDIKSYTRTMAN